MTEQQENPVHDRETCGGPAKCPYCSPPKDVINKIKAIKMTEANIPVISRTLGYNEDRIRYMVQESAPMYLVLTPRDDPTLFLCDEFYHRYDFVNGERPGEFSEVVPR